MPALNHKEAKTAAARIDHMWDWFWADPEAEEIRGKRPDVWLNNLLKIVSASIQYEKSTGGEGGDGDIGDLLRDDD